MRIILADEICPDCCRLWDIKSNKKSSTRTAFAATWATIEAYTDVAQRLGIMSEGERPQGAGPVLVKS